MGTGDRSVAAKPGSLCGEAPQGIESEPPRETTPSSHRKDPHTGLRLSDHSHCRGHQHDGGDPGRAPGGRRGAAQLWQEAVRSAGRRRAAWANADTILIPIPTPSNQNPAEFVQTSRMREKVQSPFLETATKTTKATYV